MSDNVNIDPKKFGIIGFTLDTLMRDDHYGVSKRVDFAKGIRQYTSDMKKASQKLKRLSYGKG